MSAVSSSAENRSRPIYKNRSTVTPGLVFNGEDSPLVNLMLSVRGPSLSSNGPRSGNASAKVLPWPRPAAPTADAGGRSRPRTPPSCGAGPGWGSRRRPAWPGYSVSAVEPCTSTSEQRAEGRSERCNRLWTKYAGRRGLSCDYSLRIPVVSQPGWRFS
jgi:hypothetical protein